MEELPTKNLVNLQKLKIDAQVEEFLKVKYPSNDPNQVGFLVSIDAAIEYVFKLYISLGGKYLKKGKTIYFKLCVDGREVNGVKQVAVVLVPLNLRDVFPTQAVSSVFYVGLFQMTETELSLKQTIGTIADEIKQIQSTIYNNDISPVKVFYVSDMHNIGMTFKYDMCPYCFAENVQEYNKEKRDTIEG